MTPTGSYKISEKDPDHRSNIYGNFVDSSGRVVRAGVSLKIDSAPSGTRYQGAPMRYFMRFNGGVGMHIGYLARLPGVAWLCADAGRCGAAFLQVCESGHAGHGGAVGGRGVES